MINPFVGYGAPVVGPAFYGRTKELSEVINYLQSSGSLSIVGQRRIGKTSLVMQAMLDVDKSHVFLIDLSSCRNITDFFEELMAEFRDRYVDVSPRVSDILDENTVDDYTCYRKFRKLAKELARNSIKHKVIIDEFDAVKKLEEPERLIKWLRELIDKTSETGFSAIFVSRRSLYSIEKQTAHISNLDGVCRSVFLRPFPVEVISAMCRSVPATFCRSEVLERTVYYTGGHPYLVSMFLYGLFVENSIELAEREYINSVYPFYDHLRALLTEDNLFSDMLQLVLGPVWRVEIGSEQTLRNYGLIKQKQSDFEACAAFSEHFERYLERRDREVPSWTLWSEVERGMRSLVTEVYEKKYGEDWVQKVFEKSGNAKILEDWKRKKERDRKDFGDNINLALIDYSYPMELWSLISWGWNDGFSAIFKDKRKWHEKFELLNSVRNPLAHNRGHVLNDTKLKLADAYSHEFIEIFRQECSQC